MGIRIGKVTQVFPDEGKVRVVYEDENNASLKLDVLTFNHEYLMNAVGDKVLTLHLDNGSSKGFVLGTYYGSVTPKAQKGYRKDFNNEDDANKASVTFDPEVGKFTLAAGDIELQCSYATTSVESIIKRIEALENAINH
jgi:phage baseplate assembly protein gpV